MHGFKQIGQFQTKSDDGRNHTIHVYREAASANGTPLLITADGREVALVREGVFRVYGTGMTLRSLISK